MTRGGDRAARSSRSLQGTTARGLPPATAAKLSKKVLKLIPSNVAWLVDVPIAKPPHLNDVTCNLIKGINKLTSRRNYMHYSS